MATEIRLYCDIKRIDVEVRMANTEAWAIVSPMESLLVQVGEITFGRGADHLSINRGSISAWVANNFWYTSFPGYQLGELPFRFAITTGAGAFDADAATEFGHAARVGLTVG